MSMSTIDMIQFGFIALFILFEIGQRLYNSSNEASKAEQSKRNAMVELYLQGQTDQNHLLARMLVRIGDKIGVDFPKLKKHIEELDSNNDEEQDSGS